MPKQNREVINFEHNVPTEIVLDTASAAAKQGQRTTRAGKIQYFWTYFTQDDRVFFADRDLNENLQGYAKGDKVIITNVVAPGNRWGTHKVEGTPSGPVPTPTNGPDDNKLDEILNLLRSIATTLNAKEAPAQNQNPPEEPTSKALDF